MTLPNNVIPPAGVSPASFFVPNNYVVPGEPVGILADPIDITTGEYLSIEQGFDPTDGWVITALRTARGTGSAVEDTGRDFSGITHVSPEHENDLRQQIRRALKPLLDAREITLEPIDVLDPDEQGDQYEVHVAYKRASDGAVRPLDVPLGKLIPRGGN